MSDAEKRTLRRESLAFVCCAENNRFESRHEAAFRTFCDAVLHSIAAVMTSKS